jgi:hypothetical protein
VSEASRVDVVRFVLDRLDEDDLTAREVLMSPEMVAGIPRSYAAAPMAIHIARHHPERVMLEVEAKRALIGERGEGVCDCAEYGPATWYKDRTIELVHHDDCPAVTVAASFARVWSDHPDYQLRWSQ